MQWDSGPSAGFSSVQPWLPLADDFATENVANQKRDKMSILNLYRRLISLRRSRQALQIGSYRPILARAELLLFVRQHGAERVLIALNLGAAALRKKGDILSPPHGDILSPPPHLCCRKSIRKSDRREA
jgi:alpha-glucosidase